MELVGAKREVWTALETLAAYLAYLTVFHGYLALAHIRAPGLVPFYYSFSGFVVLTEWVALRVQISARATGMPRGLALVNAEAAIGLALVIFGVKATWFSRGIFVIYPVAAWVAQVLTDMVWAHWGRRYRGRRVLAVGRRDRAAGLLRETRRLSEAGWDVRRQVYWDEEAENADAVARCRELLQYDVIDALLLVPPLDRDLLTAVMEAAREQGKEVLWHCSEADKWADARVLRLAGRTLMVLSPSPAQDELRQFAKRGMDLLLATAGMLLLSPVFLAVALAQKLAGPKDPVFFTQDRVGLNGRHFVCYKFRTMIPGADALKAQYADLNMMSGPVFKAANDPRVTPLGKILRKASLDELPQLFNVLRGEMSLVGPRPAVPDEVAQYPEVFRKRLSVRPGLTGLWQISGRNNVDFLDWMRLDLEYIESWSLFLDLTILAKTIPVVLWQRGAH